MDDRLVPAGGEARLRRPTFRVAFVVALAAGIVGLGILGPHNSASPLGSPNPSASESGTAEPTMLDRTTGGPASVSSVSNGLLQTKPKPGDVLQTWLPTQISSRSMAVLGLRLFYIVATDRIESTNIGDQSSERTLVTVPHCQTINQLAAAGSTLAYVITRPVARTGGVFGCAGPSQVAWSVNLLDLRTGQVRQVASGTRNTHTIDAAEFPVHLALSDSDYAFERPANPSSTSPASTVEVHALGGRLLWSSPVSSKVTQISLAAGVATVMTEGPPPYDGGILWLGSAANPHLREIAEPAGSASLSSDGRYVAFDLPAHLSAGPHGQSGVGVKVLSANGLDRSFTTRSGSTSLEPLQPVVASSSHGVVVAWLMSTPAGSVFPAFRFASDTTGVEIPTIQAPIWLGLEGTTLIWVTESGDGWSTGAFATDLWKLEGHRVPGQVPTVAPPQ